MTEGDIVRENVESAFRNKWIEHIFMQFFSFKLIWNRNKCQKFFREHEATVMQKLPTILHSNIQPFIINGRTTVKILL